MRTLVAVSVLLGVLGTCVASAAPKPLTLKAGYKETWAFSLQGKSVGTQDAECTGVRTVGGQKVLDWKYNLRLSLPMQGTQINLSMRGTFSVSDRAAPVDLTIDADVNGKAQRATYTVQGKTVSMTAEAGGQKIQRSAALTGDEALMVNNLMTLMSLATRTRTIAPGQTVTVPFFSAEGLRKVDLAFKAQQKTESVKVGGKPVECVVCDVSAIMARVYLDKATGEMVKYAVPAQGLEIVRQ